MVKILHTGDVHMGMAFSRYPETVQSGLIQARLSALKNMVFEANRQACNLFVVAGDLFHNISPGARLRKETIDILSGFAGNAVAILPGNHDYDDGAAELWAAFKRDMPDQMLILNEQRVYPLDNFGLEVDIYPAFCHCRRSGNNQLGWMKDITINPERLSIGITHGAVEGLSPDLQGSYFYMTQDELDAIPIDLWLLGHSHARYPEHDTAEGIHLLMCGTPEPDGLDCTHPGNAWVITADKENIRVDSFDPSTYYFLDIARTINSEQDLTDLQAELSKNHPEKLLVRLRLTGMLERSVLTSMEDYYQQLRERLYYLEVEDELRLMLTANEIGQEFTEDSFPHRWLNRLTADPAALQAAYELIGRVR